MRKIFYILVMLCFWSTIYAQDEIRMTSDLSLGLIRAKLSGTLDVGNGSSQVLGNHIVPKHPVYRRVDTTGSLLGIIIHFGVHLPVVKGDYWSTGFKINAGLGYNIELKAAEGLSSLAVSLPQYVFYRNFASDIDIMVLLGYKYTYSVLPTHLVLAGVEFILNDETGLRLYGSLNSYNYYRLLTNGNIEPAIKMREFGIAFTKFFGD